MKSIIIFLSLIFISIAQTNVLFYGTNSQSVGVSFVDTNLTATARTKIIADLQLCLQEWGKESWLNIVHGADEPEYDGYLSNFSLCPYYPEKTKFPKGIVSNGSASTGYALQIPKSLSDTYTNKFAWAEANSNIVSAAYSFVSFISSTNFYSVTSNNISDYFFANKAPEILYRLSFVDITNEIHYATFYPPSILGFAYATTGPANTNLWLGIPIKTMLYADYVEWLVFPALWHEGKWRLCWWEDDPHYKLPQ